MHWISRRTKVELAEGSGFHSARMWFSVRLGSGVDLLLCVPPVDLGLAVPQRTGSSWSELIQGWLHSCRVTEQQSFIKTRPLQGHF